MKFHFVISAFLNVEIDMEAMILSVVKGRQTSKLWILSKCTASLAVSSKPESNEGWKPLNFS